MAQSQKGSVSDVQNTKREIQSRKFDAAYKIWFYSAFAGGNQLIVLSKNAKYGDSGGSLQIRKIVAYALILSGFWSLNISSNQIFAAEVKGTLALENFQYPSTGESVASQSDNWFRLRVLGARENRTFFGKYEVEGASVANANMTSYYLLIPNLYFGYKLSDTAKLSLGRNKMMWNHADDEWKLGVWQPRFRWDYLRPESVGLNALFLEIGNENYGLTAFASPLYVPEEARPIQERDGALVSDGRWFSSPQSEMRVIDKDTRIRYRLDIPNYQEIVLKSGYGLSGRLGNMNDGLWTQAGYAYKPVNQILFRFQGYLKVDEEKRPEGEVVVVPRVNYHHLRSLEGGYTGRQVSAWLSVMSEQPEEDPVVPGWTMQRISPLFISSATVQFRFPLFEKAPTQMSLSYLKATGGESHDEGDLSLGKASIFGSRVEFSEAVSMKLEGPLVKIARIPVGISTRWIYDFPQQGTLAMTEFQISPAPNWNIVMGADILGTTDDESAEKGILYKYRANDRVYGGLNLVF